MNKYLIYLTLFLSFITFYACQEAYNNDDVNADKKIPVIEGLVKNDSGPHKVLLYYATSYNENTKKSISGATVYVIDDNGNTYYYHEQSSGAYFSDEKTFYGQIGRSYTLFVEMPDGQILKSDPELLRDTLRIQEIIRKQETREEYYTNNDNQIVTRKVTGQANYAVIDPSFREKSYYRLDSYYMIYIESVFDSTYFAMVMVNGKLYEFMVDSTVYSKCVDVNTENVLPRIGEYNPGNDVGNIEFSFFIRNFNYYLSEDLDTINDKSLFTYLFNISPEAYNYYREINNQLSASTRIYAPLPTQIIGNMHCITDSSQVVLGYFEVSSFTLNKTNEFPYKISCQDSVSITTSVVENN